ncbi:Vacuolar ATPase assembly integral membrane protein VMA21 homolog [Nesidiocoris tenuis]|uniref:Vacuolar ATPase assembly integral membrane protein VMA21 homolog n=1 Tax=Nesidiocoris tenuis TaxID=355587 RepID=A0ABN7B3D4_9HEMI|nr:Vacuolar ATPase assembly integral membrane protein VMA21 homolog [Nesidiocoris tenuis]
MMNIPDKNVSQDMSDFRIFKTVFYYCMIIIALPVITFFASKVFLFDGIFGYSSIPSNVYSAISAIAVLHIALGFYIYRAYSDPMKPSKQD